MSIWLVCLLFGLGLLPQTTYATTYRVVDQAISDNPTEVESVVTAIERACQLTPLEKNLILMDRTQIDTIRNQSLIINCPVDIRKNQGSGIIEFVHTVFPNTSTGIIFNAPGEVFGLTLKSSSAFPSLRFQQYRGAVPAEWRNFQSKASQIALQGEHATIQVAHHLFPVTLNQIQSGATEYGSYNGPALGIIDQSAAVVVSACTFGEWSSTQYPSSDVAISISSASNVVLDGVTFVGDVTISGAKVKSTDLVLFGSLELSDFNSSRTQVELIRARFKRWFAGSANPSTLSIEGMARARFEDVVFETEAVGTSHTVFADNSEAGGGLVHHPYRGSTGLRDELVASTVDYDRNGCADLPEGSNQRDEETDGLCSVDGHAPAQW